MISLTPDALSIVRVFTVSPRLADDSGVRIAPRRTGRLKVAAVGHREEDDVVVELSGARLYVDPAAWPRVRDKVLDARRDGAGRVEFHVRAQDPRPSDHTRSADHVVRRSA